MAKITMEVRHLDGQPLPEFGYHLDDPGYPVDHSHLAQIILRTIHEAGGPLTAYSIHFLRDGAEIGSWSLRRGLTAETAAPVA